MQRDYDHINGLKIKDDTTAKRLFPEDWSYDGDNVNAMNHIPIILKYAGNGNCLYNAISILFSGYEDVQCDLIKIWLKNRYLHNKNDFNNYSSTDVYSYEDDIFNGIKNGKYCGVLNVAALPNVLQIPIQSIYSKLSNFCVDRDFFK